MYISHIIRFIILVFLSMNLCYAETVVKHVRGDSANDARLDYFIELLKLAMEKTKVAYGPYRLEMSTTKMVQSRAISSVAKGDGSLDVVFSMASKKREEQMRPIRVPLLKGLLGHRIFIINAKDASKFAAIKTKADLKKLQAGQGHDWPDTQILKANGVRVKTSPKYEGLFKMLKTARFDYFPRGVNEPFDEVAARPDMDLIVEDTLLIKYSAPQFFFTNKDNEKLAERIEKGLEMAIKDGSFDELFFNHPSTQKIFAQANINNRKVFFFDNPFLSADTKKLLDESRYWYNPSP